MTRLVTIVCAALGVAAQGQTTQPAMQAIDACGILVQGSGCVLFQGAGGKYVVVVSDGDFQFGDAVRVVGTVDTGCITICADADGCIRGATLYDPAVFPCGTSLPNLPADLVSGLCSTLSASLLTLTVVGLWCTARSAKAAKTPTLPSSWCSGSQ